MEQRRTVFYNLVFNSGDLCCKNTGNKLSSEENDQMNSAKHLPLC